MPADQEIGHTTIQVEVDEHVVCIPIRQWTVNSAVLYDARVIGE